MKTVFLDIQNKLRAIAAARYIGEDWGQLNFEVPPVDFPCILIDLGDTVYSSVGRNMQQATTTLNITVADCRHYGVTPMLPEKETGQAFQIFDLLNDVHRTLHGTGGPGYSALCRKSVKKMLREDGIREFLVTFEFGYTDTAVAGRYEQRPVPPELAMNRK